MNISYYFKRECSVLIYQNGSNNHSKYITLPLTKDIHLKQIFDVIRKKFQLRKKSLRLFNSEGVELFQEDLPYLKH